MYNVGRVVSTSVSTCCRKSMFNGSRRSSSYSFPRAPKKSNKGALFIVVGGVAVLLGWAVKPNTAQAEDPKPAVAQEKKRQRLVILGSGWAALELVRHVDTKLYEVSVVSPRNYFLFTPLLAGTCVGTVEFQSVAEPLRKHCSNAEIKFYEAICTDVLYDKNTIRCEEATGVDSKVKTFDLEYDSLVVAVGAQTNNMGTKGVQENALFLKDIHDAKKIRKRITECFETANFPNQTEEEIKRLLQFVIVGGGPTGVEFSAELHDFIKEDVPKYFPQLAKKVTITMIQSAEYVLNTGDLKISKYVEQKFQRDSIDLVKNARVVEVGPSSITVFDKQTSSNKEIPCGMCVWATGVGPTPLTQKLAASIPGQNNNKALVGDDYLRVKGIPNQNVYAVGDCLTLPQRRLMDRLVELFNEADADKSGSLDMDELHGLFVRILPEFPHIQPYTRGIEHLIKQFDENMDGKLQIGEFKNLLATVDKELKSIPATAQAASQAGKYLARSLNDIGRDKNAPLSPFRYNHLGSMVYVGGDNAAIDSPAYRGGGFGVWWLWRATYFSKQLSWGNRLSLGFDWLKTRFIGRDISKV